MKWQLPERRGVMGKIVCCSWVHPDGCDFVARGESDEDVLEQAKAHALQHGIEPTPELLLMVRAYIEEE